MKILTIGTSLKQNSINRQLAQYAAQLISHHISDASLENLDLKDYEMPIYSEDRENADGIPDLAHQFFKMIGAADLIVISFAEHNGTYTSAFKNVFDWASRINPKVFQNKNVVALSASPGPGGGSTVLGHFVSCAPFFGMTVVADFSVGRFYDVFDMDTSTFKDKTVENNLHTTLQGALNHDA